MSITTDKDGVGYFHGDKCQKTGRTVAVGGATTFSFSHDEYIFLDGHRCGETFWQPGEGVEAADPLDAALDAVDGDIDLVG